MLVATGRRPYTEGLGLDALGIKSDKLGRIEVKEGVKHRPTHQSWNTKQDTTKRSKTTKHPV